MRKPTVKVRKDGSTAYYVRYRVTAKDGGKDGQTSQTFDDKARAELFCKWLSAYGVAIALDKLDEVEDAAAPVVPEVDAVPTMSALAADCFRLNTRAHEGTKLSYQREWNRTWGKLIGHVPADEMTKDMVREATLVLAGHYGNKSLRKHRGILTSVCWRAVDKGYQGACLTARLSIPNGKSVDAAEVRYLSREEIEHLILSTHPHYRRFVRFLADTGCRWQEAVVLQVGAVSFTDPAVPIVHFKRALKASPDGNRFVAETKTPKGNRRVPIVGECAADVRRLAAGRSADELLFTAVRGGMIGQSNFADDVWRKTLVKAELGKPHPTPHAFRHSFISQKLEDGVPAHIVQQLVGHESIVTTNGYTHTTPSALLAAVQAVTPPKPKLTLVRDST